VAGLAQSYKVMGNFYPGTESTAPIHRTHSLDEERQYESHLVPYSEPPFHTLPSHGGTFFSANNVITAENVNHTSIRHHADAVINILHRAAALEALYDSADSFPQPRCHPETRTKMLDDLYKWAIQDKFALPMRWLHGPAGAGKSAIMQTLCRKLQDAGCLGGAFFFKRDHSTRGNAKVLFATLAYQLALNNCHLKPLISQRVEDDPSIVGRDMDIQLHKLIVGPLRDAASAPSILLIDGLDECDTHCVQLEILRLIAIAVSQHPKTFRCLIASRPEAHIRETFSEPLFHGTLDSLNVEQSFVDIRRYLGDEFARIHREHHETMGSVPTPWPSPHILEMLVQKSSGYFIYASTIIKFIDDKFSRPTEKLEAVQNLTPTDSDAPLDQLYLQILSGVPTRFRSKVRDILYCALFFQSPRLTTFLQIERLLELQPGDIRLMLRGLHSVLDMRRSTMCKARAFSWHPNERPLSPPQSGVISVHHASFLDFLQDSQRSSIFHIGLETRTNVACAVLKALSDDNHWLDNPHHPLAWYVDLLSKCSFLTFFIWRHFEARDVISRVTSLPPSTELLSRMRLVNPDFVWWRGHIFDFESEISKVLNWLRVSCNTVTLSQSPTCRRRPSNPYLRI
jgi:hypothetical protein